jgi:hypothetical protein
MKEINLKSSTIEKSLDLAKDFLQTLIGPSVGELGQFFADKVKVWRLKNQINTLEKVQKIIKEKNIQPQQVNLKVLLPYLDAVSLEEDEKLQDIWANLLVNYIDSKKNLTSVVYPNILKQLSSYEIELLSELKNNDGTMYFSNQGMIEDCANLIRLGLVENPRSIRHGDFTEVVGTNPSSLIQLTLFGEEFYKACQRDA